MKNHNTQFEQNLFHYVEEQVTGRRVLDDATFQEIERRLSEDAALRDQANAVARHLEFLQRAPRPEPPVDLASRCLEACRRPSTSSTWSALWRVWVPALTALLLVFGAGLWMGRQGTDPIPEAQDETLVKLVQTQKEWVEKVQSVYTQKVLASNREIPDTFQYFASTSEWLEENALNEPSSHKTRQALSVALYQNILVLQSLYQSIENNPKLYSVTAVPEPTPTVVGKV